MAPSYAGESEFALTIFTNPGCCHGAFYLEMADFKAETYCA